LKPVRNGRPDQLGVSSGWSGYQPSRESLPRFERAERPRAGLSRRQIRHGCLPECCESRCLRHGDLLTAPAAAFTPTMTHSASSRLGTLWSSLGSLTQPTRILDTARALFPNPQRPVTSANQELFFRTTQPASPIRSLKHGRTNIHSEARSGHMRDRAEGSLRYQHSSAVFQALRSDIWISYGDV